MTNLVRYFFFVSLASIIAVALALGWLYRDIAEENLVEQAQSKNVALTQTLANSLWPKYAKALNQLADYSPDAIRQQPVIEELKQSIIEQSKGLDIVKVNIYLPSGFTIFSSETPQIGKDKSASLGFQQSLSGTVASKLVFKNEFNSFEGHLSNRNIIETYVPVMPDDGGRAEAVFELYSDVTSLVEQIAETEHAIYTGVFVILLLLFMVQMGFVRYFDTLLKRERIANQDHQKVIEYQANHDKLTSLPNYGLFSEHLRHAMSLARRNKQKFAVLHIGLDRFKKINEALGQKVGDEVIKQCSNRLMESIRDCDTLCRFQGDEFIVILENTHKPQELHIIAQRVIKNLSKTIWVNEHELFLTPSIGISIYPDDGDNHETLTTSAANALLNAKTGGGNTYRLFAEKIQEKISQRLELETKLHHAIEKNEFILHFQPLVDMHQQEAFGVEALVRWNNTDLGLVSPAQFIPLLEDTGLIIPVGNWIVEEACRQALNWHALGALLKVHVNLSPRQFHQENFAQVIKDILQRTQFPAKQLELEITESLLVEDVEDTIKLLNELRDIGVSFSIDDFGTGYSSLSYLRNIPVQTLKIDRSFVKDLSENPDDSAIINAVSTLAKNLKLDVIAEGVETTAQADILKANGIRAVQGFLYSKPVSGDELMQKLNDIRNGKWKWDAA